jgi:ligand-binding sensor domain-containing protein/two-component sensor histidine kinase
LLNGVLFLRSLQLGTLAIGLLIGVTPLLALDSSKEFTQYTRTVWTQAQGLPQDSVRVITQTADGYLWLGTSEGLVRFDGYEFVTYTKREGFLPGNGILSFAAGRDGTLWIGTSEGLASYKGGNFRVFGPADGVPNKSITSLVEDTDGSLWMVAVGSLNILANGKVRSIPPEKMEPIRSVRVVYQDPDKQMWVAGIGGIAKREGHAFVPVLGREELGDTVITTILKCRDELWMAGGKGVTRLRPGHPVQHFTTKDGLPNDLALELMEDHTGTVWVGTYNGLSRYVNGRFQSPPSENLVDRGLVWSIFEDREGNLWVGAQSSLTRLRDDPFTMYGKPEGLPSNSPMAVHEDKAGRLWIAYRDSGLTAFHPGPMKTYTTRDGLASNEIYSVRDGANGDLLISTTGGLSRMSGGKFVNYVIHDPAGRTAVNDALVDSSGQLWAAAPSGVFKLVNGTWQPAIPSGSNPSNYVLLLSEGPDHSIWASTFLGGVWRIQGTEARLFTVADGLASDQVRSLVWDERTLWIASIEGGLTRYRDGVFQHYRARDGLLSDNVAHIDDDHHGSLWLSTTKGLCRISKQQLEDFADGKIKRLAPMNYGVAQGLRSTHMSPAFPAGGGGTMTRDGRLWFTSGNGLVSIHPQTDFKEDPQNELDPVAHVVGVSVDGKNIEASNANIQPGFKRIEFDYVGLHLSAPESVQYFYRLDGQDQDWTPAEGLRKTSYNNLPHGDYRFLVKATEPGGRSSEAQFNFSVLPHFYETVPFLILITGALVGTLYGGYRYRLAQVHARFAMVFEERARLAREIHDTIAQGYVGISHQLDALSGKLEGDPAVAREQLDLARKMARHSLTEARRSMIELRVPELQEQTLAQALAAAAHRWVAGSPLNMHLDIGEEQRKLPPDVEQNLFRIAQEAVVNVLKHAKATAVWLKLSFEGNFAVLTVQDDGAGFDTSNSFSGTEGSFGIIGMRERAERLGGTCSLSSKADVGTRVEVRVPCPSKHS